jgi:hypothetical protein
MECRATTLDPRSGNKQVDRPLNAQRNRPSLLSDESESESGKRGRIYPSLGSFAGLLFVTPLFEPSLARFSISILGLT